MRPILLACVAVGACGAPRAKDASQAEGTICREFALEYHHPKSPEPSVSCSLDESSDGVTASCKLWNSSFTGEIFVVERYPSVALFVAEKAPGSVTSSERRTETTDRIIIGNGRVIRERNEYAADGRLERRTFYRGEDTDPAAEQTVVGWHADGSPSDAELRGGACRSRSKRLFDAARYAVVEQYTDDCVAPLVHLPRSPSSDVSYHFVDDRFGANQRNLYRARPDAAVSSPNDAPVIVRSETVCE